MQFGGFFWMLVAFQLFREICHFVTVIPVAATVVVVVVAGRITRVNSVHESHVQRSLIENAIVFPTNFSCTFILVVVAAAAAPNSRAGREVLLDLRDDVLLLVHRVLVTITRRGRI
jgi:hypothetical protein